MTPEILPNCQIQNDHVRAKFHWCLHFAIQLNPEKLSLASLAQLKKRRSTFPEIFHHSHDATSPKPERSRNKFRHHTAVQKKTPTSCEVGVLK
jgi:hypothetical protein